jgi:DDE superfamily endonuclease
VPAYVAGLIGPGDRNSVQPMAERLAPGDYDQLHHFVAAGVWDAAPLETELLIQADRLVGTSDAVLVIDDTAVPKKGAHSVGVAAQYASAVGKTANCQTLVSLTLARGEVHRARPAAIGDDLLILRKLGEPPFQLIERHVERTWQMAERELVLRANVEQGHATILKPAKQFLTRDQTYELGPGRIGRGNATPNLIP